MIAESALRLGAPVGAGGSADTFLVNGPVRPDLPADLVYKRWRTGASAQETAHVIRLVEFREHLSAPDQAFLDSVAAWPAELVGSRGIAEGFLMPLAPPRFMYHDAARGLTTAAVNLLYAKAQRGRRAGAAVPSDRDLVARLTITAQLAYVLRWLHDRGAVFGDISHANELFTVQGQAGIYLIDLDGIVIPGSAVRQADTPGYIPPESSRLGGRATRESDAFKFTLVLVRILAHPREQLTQTASPDFLVGILDQEGLDLVARGLSTHPPDRPTLAEYYEYLYRFIGAQLSPPQIGSVTLAPEFAIRGDSVQVEAEVAGAERVIVRGPDGHAISHQVAGSRVSATFAATSSGPVTVEAANQHGTASARSIALRVLPPVPPPVFSLQFPEQPSWAQAPAQMFDRFREGAGIARPPVLGADQLANQYGDPGSHLGFAGHYLVRAPERVTPP